MDHFDTSCVLTHPLTHKLSFRAVIPDNCPKRWLIPQKTYKTNFSPSYWFYFFYFTAKIFQGSNSIGKSLKQKIQNLEKYNYTILRSNSVLFCCSPDAGTLIKGHMKATPYRGYQYVSFPIDLCLLISRSPIMDNHTGIYVYCMCRL